MCVLRGCERGEKKSGVLIGVKNHTTTETMVRGFIVLNFSFSYK